MEKKKSKIILSALVALLCVITLVFLGKTVPEVQRTSQKLPKLGSEPIYVELNDGEPLTRTYTNTSGTVDVMGLEVLLLNIGDDVATTGSEQNLEIKVSDDKGQEVSVSTVQISEMSSGQWYNAGTSFTMENGATYSFTFVANGCNPYFMQVNGYEPGISIGFDVVTDKSVTYGEMFYFSVPVVIIIAFLLITYLLYPAFFSSFKKNDRTYKIFSPVFLVLLFIALALKIYQASYVDSVYISADSDGYLREAVNLLKGHGFSYEGIAGYKSHFANWPIVYPAMIAFAMMLTGANAYLASKYVAMVMIAAIFAVLYVIYKEKAWLYGLAFTNLGFITMCYYTWSEVPFVLFLLLFSIAFSRIVSESSPKTRDYVLLSASGILAFLTRYFGIYLWFMVGPYWLYLLARMIKEKLAPTKKIYKDKLIGILVSGTIFVVTAFSYLLMNKKLNGYPTGVSRGTWWDDYAVLTDDLFKSLMTEIFNVFSVETPEFISGLSVKISALFIFLVIGLIFYCVVTAKKKSPLNLVLIVNAAVYYVIFIIVRYRSSMDTFYFRFFAPATVLLVMGLVGIFVDNGLDKKRLHGFSVLALGTVIVVIIGFMVKSESWNTEQKAYEIVTGTWDSQYANIPEKSVIIWSDMDYRSTWYRPDVYNGDLYSGDTWESLQERYFASGYLCIKKEDAQALIDISDYDSSILDRFKEAIEKSDENSKYIVMELN